MATAQLQFVNGVTVNSPGLAITANVGDSITAQNSDDTGVDTWKFVLAEIPPGSALTLGDTQGPSNVANTYTFVPDVPGTYRILLKVTPDGDGTTDIRDVLVPFTRRGIICPPFQGVPAPLPLPGSGDPNAKDNEMNISGQYRGWMGDDTPGQQLLYQSLYLLDTLAHQWSADIWVDPNTTIPSALQNGTVDFPFASISDGVAALFTDGVLHLASGDYSGTSINIQEDVTIVGPGNAPLSLPNFNNPFPSFVRVFISDATFAASFTGNIHVFADRVDFQTSFACPTLDAKRCNLPFPFATTGEFTLEDCDIGSNINCGDVAASILRSRFSATSTITFTGSPGTLTLDELTLRSYITRQCSTSNGTASTTRFSGPVWTAYSPTITGINVGTTGSIDSFYRIVGDTCQTRHAFVLGGTGISLGSIFIPLPLGLNVDQNKLQFTFQTPAVMGGRNSGGTSVAFGNPLATWSGGSPTGLTLDSAPGYAGLTAGARFIILLDMPFKIP